MINQSGFRKDKPSNRGMRNRAGTSKPWITKNVRNFGRKINKIELSSSESEFNEFEPWLN